MSSANRRCPRLRALRWTRIMIGFGSIGLLCLGVNGCRDHAEPELREPIVSFDARALERFLERTMQLEGTPLGSESRLLAARLERCPEAWAHPDPEALDGFPLSLLSRVACRDASLPETHLEAFARERRGDHHGLVLWPVGDLGRLELRIDVDESGGVEIEGSLVPGETLGAYGLLVPGSEAPASPAIESSGALLHLRMRPRDGIALSTWIDPGTQADRLFALKGRLLEGALLSGTWELALMPPREGQDVPLLVGALHHRMAGPIEQALDETLDQLEATWPIRRTPRSFETPHGRLVEGGCFLDLPLLPELAPCWVVTEEALLIGYRGEALDAALGPAAVSSPQPIVGSLESASRLNVRFDRIGVLDRRLAPGERATRPGDIWSTLHLEARALDAREIAIHARLRTGS